MSATHLIVNADDLGMSRGITDAIIIAHRYGFLTSASLMPNMPAADYAIDRVSKFPSLGVGVHLNICFGRPLLPPADVRSLVGPDGTFHSPRVMIRRLFTGRVRSREIFAEFTAQIRWMKQHGIAPTHADSHHHMHLYPAAVLPFVRALKSEGIRCARSPRCTVWTRGSSTLADRLGGPHEGPFARRAFVRGYRSALQFGAFRSFRMPSARLSFHSRDRHNLEALEEQWKLALLAPAPGIFELTCHPGLPERGFSERDSIRDLRENELHWLADREMREILTRNQIQLITYRHLAEHPAAQPAPNHAPVLP